jgi:hypothetical protein
MEDDMSEIEMTNDVETEEEFTDELCDEALDREERRSVSLSNFSCAGR